MKKLIATIVSLLSILFMVSFTNAQVKQTPQYARIEITEAGAPTVGNATELNYVCSGASTMIITKSYTYNNTPIEIFNTTLSPNLVYEKVLPAELGTKYDLSCKVDSKTNMTDSYKTPDFLPQSINISSDKVSLGQGEVAIIKALTTNGAFNYCDVYFDSNKVTTLKGNMNLVTYSFSYSSMSAGNHNVYYKCSYSDNTVGTAIVTSNNITLARNVDYSNPPCPSGTFTNSDCVCPNRTSPVVIPSGTRVQQYTCDSGSSFMSYCSVFDVDGDGTNQALVDGVLINRVLNEYISDSNLLNGITLSPKATRITASAIRDFVKTNLKSYDVDGDGRSLAGVDGVLITRYMLGLTGATLISDISVPTGVTGEAVAANIKSNCAQGSTTMCTAIYKPVCGRARNSCDGLDPTAAMACRPAAPVYTTYSNRCQLEAAGAVYMYDGACDKTVATTTQNVIPNIWSVSPVYEKGDYVKINIQLPNEIFDGCDVFITNPSGFEQLIVSGGCVQAGYVPNASVATGTIAGFVSDSKYLTYANGAFGTYSIKVIVKKNGSTWKTLTTSYQYKNNTSSYSDCLVTSAYSLCAAFGDITYEVSLIGGCGPNPLQFRIGYNNKSKTLNLLPGDTADLGDGVVLIYLGSACSEGGVNFRFKKLNSVQVPTACPTGTFTNSDCVCPNGQGPNSLPSGTRIQMFTCGSTTATSTPPTKNYCPTGNFYNIDCTCPLGTSMQTVNASSCSGSLLMCAQVMAYSCVATPGYETPPYVPEIPINSTPTVCIEPTVNLGVGSRGSAVTDVQKFLNTRGYLSNTPTGYFGSATRAAVIKFQSENGINTTGYVGQLTRAQLRTKSCEPLIPIPDTPVETSATSIPNTNNTNNVISSAPASAAVVSTINVVATAPGFSVSSVSVENGNKFTIVFKALDLTFDSPHYVKLVYKNSSKSCILTASFIPTAGKTYNLIRSAESSCILGGMIGALSEIDHIEIVRQ
jgi:peptidoglycan hydrolase-like protein with peptidoglycan-binding domain